MQGLRVVIPAFNAGDFLENLLRGVFRYVAAEQVIVVDDGSYDQTASITQCMGAQILKHTVNRGKGAALKYGLHEAFKDGQVGACITMDADGQHEPQFIPDFIKTMEGAQGDLIIGVRRLHPAVMPWPRVLSNRLTSSLMSAKLGRAIPDSQSGYRLITRRAFELLKLSDNGFELESQMLIEAVRAGLKIAWIPISTIYADEKSSIRGVRDTWRFIRTYLR